MTDYLIFYLKTSTLFNIIDIGCGLGISTNYIHKKYKFKSYIGVDISDDLINISKKINKDLSINFFIKDVSSLLLEKKEIHNLYVQSVRI